MNFQRKCLVFGLRNIVRIQKVRVLIVVEGERSENGKGCVIEYFKNTSISAHFARPWRMLRLKMRIAGKSPIKVNYVNCQARTNKCQKPGIERSRNVGAYASSTVPAGIRGFTITTSSRSMTTAPGFAPFGLRTYFLRV